MNRPSYKELWLYEHKDRDEQLQWIRDAVDGNAKFCNSEPPYSEEEELARKIMQMHARIAELEAERRWIPVGEKPLEAGTFFVLLKNGEVTKDFTFIDGGRYYWWNHGANITHYMPLPTPPEVQE